MGTHTGRLMGRVAARQRLAALGRSFHLFLLCAACAYGLALLASRLLGVIPDYWRLLQVPLLAVVALAAAVVFHRRPAPHETARLIDRQADTNDLFLTAALIRTAAGAYKPLVLRDAEKAAETIEPRAVAPFHWWPRTRTGALALAALCAAMLWVPQIDPFGREAERQQQVEQHQKLEEGRKATELRLAELKEQGDEAQLSKAVLKATEDLKKTLNAMKPADQKGNFQKMTAERTALSQMWRKAGEKQAADALKQDFEPQQFGEGQGRKVDEWKKQLEKGNADALKKEMEDLKEMAEKLAKMPEGAEKRALQQKMNQELKDLADFASSQAGNPSLNAALQRAMEQLAMSDMQGMSKDALQALQQSLQLSEAEMEKLAQSMRDMKELEQALRTLQLAQRLNQDDQLDGGQCQNCASLADYEALYRQMMAARGLEGTGEGQGGEAGDKRGRGAGMGGPGEGEGSVAPEDPSAATGFKSEKEQTSLTAGRILLSMKTKGVSEKGEATQNYEQAVDDVKQGVSEAIVHEQIPPAYHDTIRKVL